MYLVRQAPVTIVGSGQPESSGLIDPTTGLPVQGIQYDAGDPAVYNGYQYVDNSGTPGAPVVTSTVGPSGVAYGPIVPVSVTTATTLSTEFNAQLQGIGPYNASEYAVSGSGSLNLNNEVLSLELHQRLRAGHRRPHHAGRRTPPATPMRSRGHFDNASGQQLQNGSEVYATDGQGNVLTDSSGQPIYFRIFYPGGGIGPDGGTTDNQNVYLVRQAPVTILGTSTPGSTGLFDSSGNPVLDIEYDAGDPRTFDGYQYVDASGGYQRSLISEIKVTFTGIVDSVDASQLNLSLSQDSNETVGLQVTATQVVGEDTMVTLTFLPNQSDPGLTRQRQLADGELTDFVLSDLKNWTFTVNAGAVTQYAAHQVGGSLEGGDDAEPQGGPVLDAVWGLPGDAARGRHGRCDLLQCLEFRPQQRVLHGLGLLGQRPDVGPQHVHELRGDAGAAGHHALRAGHAGDFAAVADFGDHDHLQRDRGQCGHQPDQPEPVAGHEPDGRLAGGLAEDRGGGDGGHLDVPAQRRPDAAAAVGRRGVDGFCARRPAELDVGGARSAR